VAQSDTSKVEAEFFDRFVTDRGEFNPFADRGWRTLARRFSQQLGDTPPVDLLDVGCGTGNSRQIYIERCRGYTGIDLSPRMIEVARERFPGSQWQVADATSLPFADSSFDVVAFSAVLHHIPDYSVALREGFRVLRPGGLAFAFDPNLMHPAMALFRWPKSPMYSCRGVSPNERPLLPRQLRAEFAGAGFVELWQRCQGDIPYHYVAPKLLNACLSLYNAADRLLSRLALDRIFGVLVLTSGRKPSLDQT
jgi:ubiquinone/menaquinone biosynthesis C-methylase UbiE